MNLIEYNEFKSKCVTDLSEVQEGLRENYNLNWFESWFYDQHTGLFTLTDKEKEVNFKYANVGTYSRKTRSWKWSWDNEGVLDKVKSEITKVKAFGDEHSLEQLATGYFEEEEYVGWQLTAIAAKLLNAIGAYRAVDEHLLIFMVLLEVVDNNQAETIKAAFVSCEEHGTRRKAFVCQHLNKDTKTGFVEAFHTWRDMELDEDDDFQAWCDLCEEERAKAGEWNDKTMELANIKLVCEDCYFEIKASCLS